MKRKERKVNFSQQAGSSRGKKKEGKKKSDDLSCL